MKKLVLGAVASAAVVAGMVLVPSVAGATGGTTPPANSITIGQYADYGLNGTNLDVDLEVRCTGGSGFVQLEVQQYYPETPNTAGAYGISTPTPVVCDGTSRYVNATIVGSVFDGGKAKAKAFLVNGKASTQRWITIIAH